MALLVDRVANVCRIRFVAVVVLAFTGTAASAQQSLDQKAWNAVWDRLAQVLPQNTPTESVHALRVIIPATWATGSEDGLKELQQWASAIPEEQFTIDPTRLKLRLHDVYARAVLDVDLPMPTEAQRTEFRKARTTWDTAYTAFLAKRKAFLALWKEHQDDLKARNEPINSQALLKFRNSYSGYFTAVQGELDDAMLDLQKYAPIANYWVQAVRKIRNKVSDTQSVLEDIYDYDGGIATLTTISTDCTDSSTKGWDFIIFNSAVTSVNSRSSSWNGNGGWAGTFFSANLGGGGGGYDLVIQNAGESVTLKFCNLTYIQMSPGAWFDYSVLQGIDSGALPLKEGSPYRNKKLLGKDGIIGRLVKGAVVARSVQFSASMSESKLTEMRKNSGGSGGIRIGPWSIGGSGGSSEFKQELASQNGTYGRATATSVPVLLAIITEPTK